MPLDEHTIAQLLKYHIAYILIRHRVSPEVDTEEAAKEIIDVFEMEFNYRRELDGTGQRY